MAIDKASTRGAPGVVAPEPKPASKPSTEPASTGPRSNATTDAPYGDDQWVTTPVWRGENEFASRGQTEIAELPGVKKGATELRAESIHVRGQKSFSAGALPGDEARAKADGGTYPDSFVQAEAYHALAQVRDTFDGLGLPLKFDKLVAAKSGQKELLATVNAMRSERIQASYFPGTEELIFGTLLKGNKAIWDLGADMNVAQHEAGHFVLDHLVPGLRRSGSGGALHEGYADAQAALLSRDPDIAEDYGKSSGIKGEALRTVANKKRLSQTTDEVHERGEVFAGYFWAIAEELHTEITGKARAQGLDAEALDPTAAREALKILWSFPLYLGSKQPSPPEVAAAVERTITRLGSQGSFDSRIDVTRLVRAAQKAASTRELNREPVRNAPTLVRAATAQAAAEMALQKAGFGGSVTELKPLQVLPGPAGETTYRYELARPVALDDGSGALDPVMVPVEDDFVTVVQTKDGYEVQVGTLPEHYATPESPSMFQRFVNWMMPSPTETQLELVAPERGAKALVDHARQDLERLLDPAPGWMEQARRLVADGPDDLGGRALLAESHKALKGSNAARRPEASKGQLVWRQGKLQLQLILGPITYYAGIGADGRITSPERVVNAFVQ